MPSPALDNDACPVGDDLLGEMYRASEHGLPQLVESVSSDVRAMLALFCYRRSHLHALAISIASSCSQRDLVDAGGRVGLALYALSRDIKARPSSTPSSGRKPITLSTAPLKMLPPLEDDFEDDDADSNETKTETGAT